MRRGGEDVRVKKAQNSAPPSSLSACLSVFSSSPLRAYLAPSIVTFSTQLVCALALAILLPLPAEFLLIALICCGAAGDAGGA